MLAHVGQRLAHHLGHDLAVLGRQHVLGADVGELDPDSIKTRELLRMLAQLADDAGRTDPGRAKVGERLADLLQGALEDLQHVRQGLVLTALGPFHVDLEKRDRAGQLRGDAVVQLAGHPGPLPLHRVVDGLLGERLVSRLDPRATGTHRAAIRRA